MRCFNVHRIRYDYRFIDVMGQNFFNNKFSIKSTFLKVRGATFIETDSPTVISSLLLSLAPFL